MHRVLGNTSWIIILFCVLLFYLLYLNATCTSTKNMLRKLLRL